jgi:RNA polymerase sigma-70 factor (ECF subfamily)
MARHYAGPRSAAANHESLPDGSSPHPYWAAAPAEVRNLERWAAFHEAVERLPEEERGLIELGFYEGLARDEMALR